MWRWLFLFCFVLAGPLWSQGQVESAGPTPAGEVVIVGLVRLTGSMPNLTATLTTSDGTVYLVDPNEPGATASQLSTDRYELRGTIRPSLAATAGLLPPHQFRIAVRSFRKLN